MRSKLRQLDLTMVLNLPIQNAKNCLGNIVFCIKEPVFILLKRKHRHLLQTAISFMFQAKLPSKFWPFSILLATHVINRIPFPVLNWKTPHELLFCHKPDYKDFKTFGYLCHATNTILHKDKFETRAHKCIFLGHSLGQKGYKIYDLESDKIHVNRDVIFHENIFPYHQIEEPTSHLPLSMFSHDCLHEPQSEDNDTLETMASETSSQTEILSPKRNITETQPTEQRRSKGLCGWYNF